MKTIITESEFMNAFARAENHRFSYDALSVLFDYFEELEESTGEELELDVIAICCEYTEYSDLPALQQDYPTIKTMEDLEDRTVVIPVRGTGGFVIANF